MSKEPDTIERFMAKRRNFKVFLDTSALIAGIASTKGSAREVLRLAEVGLIDVFISRQVIVEADRNIEAKLPEMLKEYRAFMKVLSPILVDDPPISKIKRFSKIINPNDAPILASAVMMEVDYLITWDKKHFIVSDVKSSVNLKIRTPGEFLKEFIKSIDVL